jgi:hypothetical protein
VSRAGAAASGVEHFKGREREYRRWLRAHRLDGYVFNHFMGTNEHDNLLHKADCDHLWRPEDEGRRTAVEKVCSTDRAGLEARLNALRGRDGWRRCGTCM